MPSRLLHSSATGRPVSASSDRPVAGGATPKPLVEELVLYALFVAIGAIPVVLTVVDGSTFGVDATLGLLMMSIGALGAVAHAARIRRLNNSRAEYR